MTIREIEDKTGMTRANVRYYEREGLLSPLRGENNYRDYSEDDLAALKKIRLLRQLRVPVAQIVRLKNGEVSLDAVLASQSAALEQESRETEEAARLCRALWESHPTYDGLDAEAWLNRSPVSETASAQAWKSNDVLFVAPHPWRRWLANGLDYALTVLVLEFFLLAVFHCPVTGENNPFMAWLKTVRSVIFQGLLEALLLCTIGTTPGKWIFGLRVRQRDGSKLSFSQAAYRAAQRFVYGEGGHILLVDLWRNWVSYKACVNEEVLPWDEGIAYSCTLHERRHWLCIPAGLLCDAGFVLIAAQALLPVHQGLLTKEEFVENCETFARQNMESYRYSYLDENLIWRESGDNGIIYYGMSSALEDTPYELQIDEDGHITAVHVEYESYEDEGLVGSYSGTASILRTAYVFANNRANAFSVLRELGNDSWDNLNWMEDFTLTDGCVRVSHEVEYRGYDMAQDFLIRGDNEVYGEDPYFRWSLTLTLIEDE